jgi:ribose transport system ATP-binding protein
MFPPIERPKAQNKLLEVQDFTTDKVHHVSFNLYEGEILGIAGLVGSGRTELAKGLFGADQIRSGEIRMRRKKVSIRSPKDALQHGIFLAPEDRKGEALVQIRSIREGITLANRRKISRLGFCNEKKERTITEKLKEDLNIRAPNVETLVQNLSGGNQQKVVVAKAINTNPDILIFDEPTQGIDVGAKYEIYEILERLRASGKSIIFISSEMEELQGMCSRIMVMRQNTVAGFVEDNLEDSEAILQLMYKGVNT